MAENQQSSTTTKHTDFDDLLSSLTTFLDSTPDPNFKQNDVLHMEMDKACKELSAATQTLFGPGGSQKLIITFKEYKMLLNGLVVEHPAAKQLVLNARSQQNEFGDGANLVVLIAGQHIEGAIELVKMGVNPSQIIDGYKKASNKVDDILCSLVQHVDVRNAGQVIQFMNASSVTSAPYLVERILCPLIAEACIQVCPKNPVNFNVDNVGVAKLLGVCTSKTLRGMVLKVDSVVGSIKEIHDAKVLVIAGGVNITDSEQLEEAKFEEVIKASRAQVIVSGAGIGQKALQFCDDNTIMVLKIASKSELDCFCRTTKAVALLKLGSTVDPFDLGSVDSILVEKRHGERVTVTNTQGGVATVLLGANNVITYDEQVKSVVNGALCRDSSIVPGAGATEFEIARQLRNFASSFTGSSDETIITKYADSFEMIPRTLAQKAHPDVENIIENLKADHEAGNVKVGRHRRRRL